VPRRSAWNVRGCRRPTVTSRSSGRPGLLRF